MHKVAQVVAAGEPQSQALADILADAFTLDPVMNWIIPASDLYPDFFRLIIRDTFVPSGIMHMESTERGAALWLPPATEVTVSPSLATAKLFARLLFRKGPGPLLRIPQQNRVFERHLPSTPHYHLLFVGARQSAQGAGVGSALLKQGTLLCDNEGMPAYLESSSEKNVPLYQRHGFEIVAQEALPGGGPEVWFMWREPR